MNTLKCYPGRQLATLLLLGLALVRFQPAAGDASRRLTHPYRWVDQVGPDRAIAEFAAGLLWLISAWLVIALLAAIWIERTGRSSRLLRRLARSTPRALQRLVFTGVGISLIASPAVASASTSSGATSSSAAATTSSAGATTPSTIAAPQWPRTTESGTRPTAALPPRSAPAAGLVPAPRWPTETARPTPATTQPSTIAGPTLPADSTLTQATPTSAAPTSAPIPTTEEPTTPAPTTPTLPASTDATEPAATPPADPTLNVPKPPPIEKSPINTSETVVIRPGDSLWTITAQQLGPTASDADIAVEWPYWYRVNHRVIGDDPGVLHPGQRLVVPSQKG